MEGISLEWILGSGFGLMFALLLIVWKSSNSNFAKVEKQLDKLDEKLTDVDRRLCRLEGAFASKDYCMIKDHRTMDQAE